MIVIAAAATARTFALDPTVMLAWLTCIGAFGSLVIACIRFGRRAGRQIMQMVEDFNGTKERPGVPAKLGVMERLQTLDLQVAHVISETSPNHGGSMKDAVSRIDDQVVTLAADVRSLHERLDGPSVKAVEVNVHP
jgi:hypothetical protein